MSSSHSWWRVQCVFSRVCSRFENPGAGLLSATGCCATPILNELGALLSGGDRRSVAGSNRIMTLILANHGRVAGLAVLAPDANWLVFLRAPNLLGRLARKHADSVQPHKRLFIGRLADS